jgi:hypothetical protein
MTRASEAEKNAARILRAFGASYPKIADLFGRTVGTVAEWCDPRRGVSRRRANNKHAARRRAAGLPYRAPEVQRHQQLRRSAREEARATGENVETIYSRRGVA